jgi:hypothetical protein
VKNRITRIVATLTLSTLTALGTAALGSDMIATTQQDTGWGAPDTTHTPLTEEAGDTVGDVGTVVDTTLGDSGWG